MTCRTLERGESFSKLPQPKPLLLNAARALLGVAQQQLLQIFNFTETQDATS